MSTSIFSKLFLKHSTPVEKFVTETPVVAENLQKIVGALAARAAPAIGRALAGGAKAAKPAIGRALAGGVKAAKPYAAQAGKAGLSAAASAGKTAIGAGAQAAKPHMGAALGAAKAGKAGGLGAAAQAAKPHLGAAGKAGLGTAGTAFGADMGARAAKKVTDTVTPPPSVSKQSFDTLFRKQQLRRGDKVQIPHKGKMTTGTIVRYDEGEQWEGKRVGSPFYVVDVGEYESVIVPKHKIKG